MAACVMHNLCLKHYPFRAEEVDNEERNQLGEWRRDGQQLTNLHVGRARNVIALTAERSRRWSCVGKDPGSIPGTGRLVVGADTICNCGRRLTLYL